MFFDGKSRAATSSKWMAIGISSSTSVRPFGVRLIATVRPLSFSRARGEATPFHLTHQPRQRRYLDRRHRSEIAEPLIAGFPKRGHDTIHRQGHAIAGNAPGKQLTHLHADAIEQIGKEFVSLYKVLLPALGATFATSNSRAPIAFQGNCCI